MGKRGDCIPGLCVDIFCVSVTVAVTVSFAPFFEGDCKRMEGYSRHATVAIERALTEYINAYWSDPMMKNGSLS